MSRQTAALRRWADALDSGRYEQITGQFLADPGMEDGDGRQRACALAVGMLSLPPEERREDLSDVAWAPYSAPWMVALGLTSELDRRVVAAVERQTGLTFPHRGIMPLAIGDLNDDFGVTFPQFAAAIRAVARQIEEQGAGERIDRSSRDAYPARLEELEELELAARELMTVVYQARLLPNGPENGDDAP